MQTYFADLLAFFGISGAPQTFAELIPWMFGVLVALGIVLACFRLISECINAGRGFVDLHSCRCRLFSALAVSRRSLRIDASFSLYLLRCQGWL